MADPTTPLEALDQLMSTLNEAEAGVRASFAGLAPESIPPEAAEALATLTEKREPLSKAIESEKKRLVLEEEARKPPKPIEPIPLEIPEEEDAPPAVDPELGQTLRNELLGRFAPTSAAGSASAPASRSLEDWVRS